MTPRTHRPAAPGTAPVPAAAVPGDAALSPVGAGEPGDTPEGGGGRAPALPSGARTWTRDEAAARLAAQMDEDAVEWHMRRLIKDLRDLGGHILAYHPWKTHAKRAASGWPDWSIAGPGGVIFRELKREGKKPTKAQQEWLDHMVAAGLDAGVWRPSDVVSGRMGAELTALAGLGGKP